MNHAARLTRLLILLVLVSGCQANPSEKADAPGPKPADKAPITVYAAASTTNALEEIKAAFAQETGTEVRTSYAASSALAQQIENGAQADLFLSADLKWADYVANKVPVAKRRNLLGNRLVIVVPSDSTLKLTRPEDLVSDDLKHLALAAPDAVPAGRYAKQALTRLELWDKLKDKVVPGVDVRQALAYVETGAAEAGIVYATDAAISKKVKVAVEIPADMTEPVRYPILLLKRSAGESSAEAFYDYLGSPEATRIFEKYGFIVLTAAGEGPKQAHGVGTP